MQLTSDGLRFFFFLALLIFTNVCHTFKKSGTLYATFFFFFSVKYDSVNTIIVLEMPLLNKRRVPLSTTIPFESNQSQEEEAWYIQMTNEVFTNYEYVMKYKKSLKYLTLDYCQFIHGET